jgi:hypothetical protein
MTSESGGGPKDEQKKDLTGIIPLPPDPSESGSGAGASELPPLPDVQDFGSLDDFIKQSPPPPEAPAGLPEPASEMPSFLPPETPQVDSVPAFETAAPEQVPGFEALPDLPSFHSENPEPPTSQPLDTPSAAPSFTPSSELPPPIPSSEPNPAQASAPSITSALKAVAERTPVGAPAVAPGYPFTLEIHGKLRHFEAGRLLDLLSQRQYGIRPMDLEPQLQAGKIRLPQLSEYAAILIIQALKDAPVRMRLVSAVDEDSVLPPSPARDQILILGDALRSGSEKIQIYPGDKPTSSDTGMAPATPIDTLTAAHEMTNPSTDPAHSRELEDTLDALKRELRTQAQRLGATAVVQFRYSLHPLHDGLKYRVIATGLAVK